METGQIEDILAKSLSSVDLSCALLSQKALQVDWEKAEEDEAWESLQETTISG